MQSNVNSTAANQCPREVPSDAAAITTEHWVDEINAATGYSAGWVILTGDLLLQAKQQLPHGEWTSIFEGRRLKFGLRTAQMLMQVARHPTLHEAKYFSSLPCAWSILYVLSQLPAEVVEQGIINGVIHPELKLAEARRLLPSAPGNGPADATAPARPAFDLDCQQKRLLGYLRRQAARWPSDCRGALAELLERLAAELRAGGNRP
jgi:hypothetical protein